MAVTPNYSWPVPVNTDLVKDGADAIKDLGDAIDATVFGLGSSALALVKTQVISTAVTSVTVTGAFSATYDSYKIVITGGTSTADNYLSTQLRTGTTTSVTGYYFGGALAQYSGAIGDVANNNTDMWTYTGYSSTTANIQSYNIELTNPFLAQPTIINSMTAHTTFSISGSGYHSVATSYDQLVISKATGSFTGGIIRVYGYAR